MKLLLSLFLLIFSLATFSEENAGIDKAKYVGDLTWEYQNFRIKQENITKTEKTWVFENVSAVWGRLYITYITPPKNEDFEISTKDFSENTKEEKSYQFNKNNRKPFIFPTKSAVEILKEDKLLTFSNVKWEKTPEYKQWEKKVAENNAAWDKYNQLSIYQRRNAKAPTQKFQLSYGAPKKFGYTTQETFKVIIPVTDASEHDYWLQTDKMISKARMANVGYFVLALIAIYIAWLILRTTYRVSKKADSKVRESYNHLRENQAKKKVRKLAEVTAMTEIIKEEIKNSSPDELSQLKKQIAEAIENGDSDKADSLLNIAERLKKLDD